MERPQIVRDWIWADKSGTGHHAVVYGNVNGNKPKYYSAGMNSKPTVQFDGSNDYLILENGEPIFISGINLPFY